MSSYRDDMNDTAVASDLVISGLADTSESTAFSKDSVIESLMVMNEDAAVASMAILDRTIAVLTDVAVISDSTTGVRQNHQSVTETARATDLLYSIIPAQVLEDAAIGSDSMLYRTRTVVEYAAQAGDDAFSRSVSRQFVIETARSVGVIWNRIAAPVLDETAIASDGLAYRTLTLATESAQGADQVAGTKIARQTTAETASASNALWSRIAAPVLDETAIASDGLAYRTLTLATESAQGAAQVIDIKTARQTTQESARARDELTFYIAAPVLSDSATASDDTQYRLRSVLSDAAQATDYVAQVRSSIQLVVDGGRCSDTITSKASSMAMDEVIATEKWLETLHAAVVVDDVAAASDYVQYTYLASVSVLESSGRATSSLFGTLRARQQAEDTAAVEDEVLQEHLAGQAWTADSDGWAMSRWAPLDFTEFSVIDGILYGIGKRGVFALDGKSETIDAQIRTGLMDIGNGTKAYIDGIYLEYRLNGSAQLDVTQTQQGKSQTYTYKLPPKPANELTSGRFETGRGLCSRHYEFALRLQGTQGHINDWRLLTAPSTRRIS